MIDLSPPKTLLENKAFRRELLDWSDTKARREAIREKCAADILWYINSWVVQFNPLKNQASIGPFLTWPIQDHGIGRILDCIDSGRSMVVEKSREMGATWMFLIVADWLCMFHSHKQALMISKNADAVDHASPNSLLWKIDFIHSYLPLWLKRGITRKKMFLGYDDMASYITGEASTSRAGSGGRATLAFIDEFSLIEDDYALYYHIAHTTNTRFFNGTHRGAGTCFSELCSNKTAIGAHIEKLQIHWTHHPEKWAGAYRFDSELGQVVVLDKTYKYPVSFRYVMEPLPAGGPFPGIRSPWYDWKCNDIGSSRAIAMDLDIDPQGSVSQVFNVQTIQQLINTYCTPPCWEGEISCDQDTGQPLELVKVPGGTLKLWIMPDAGGAFPLSRYAIAGDISTGSGTTNSCLSIVDAKTGHKVGEYATPFFTADQFAPRAVALGHLFKDEWGGVAKLAWELPGPGLHFGKRVMEMNYPNVYMREASEQVPWSKTLDQPGWYASVNSKRPLIEEYMAALQKRQFVNFSEAALRETLDFYYSDAGVPIHAAEKGKDDPTGARDNHGDRVIADALAWKMVKLIGFGTEKKAEVEAVKQGTLAWRRAIADNAHRQEQWA